MLTFLSSKWPFRHRIRGRSSGGTGISGKGNRMGMWVARERPKGLVEWRRMGSKIRKIGKGERVGGQSALTTSLKRGLGSTADESTGLCGIIFLSSFCPLTCVFLASSLCFQCVLLYILSILCKLPSILSEMREQTNQPSKSFLSWKHPLFTFLFWDLVNKAIFALPSPLWSSCNYHRFPPNLPRGSGHDFSLQKAHLAMLNGLKPTRTGKKDIWVTHAVVHLACHKGSLEREEGTIRGLL